ncbi:DEAD domain-containing protein [Rhizoctonia solani AG-1 IA]|uniref:DEAD domain-containing protein n=1 Tax=Thanatephorus cucumeris (strain AG1-IA) TaxID=983506 RepID=L8X887_THACA|nr:DEAD domain-containing protein [Rhizoctonia solani AG-1 IA]
MHEHSFGSCDQLRHTRLALLNRNPIGEMAPVPLRVQCAHAHSDRRVHLSPWKKVTPCYSVALMGIFDLSRKSSLALLAVLWCVNRRSSNLNLGAKSVNSNRVGGSSIWGYTFSGSIKGWAPFISAILVQKPTPETESLMVSCHVRWPGIESMRHIRDYVTRLPLLICLVRTAISYICWLLWSWFMKVAGQQLMPPTIRPSDKLCKYWGLIEKFHRTNNRMIECIYLLKLAIYPVAMLVSWVTHELDASSMRGNNNPAPRSSQNKSQILEATMRNVPKLKEQNYTQWNNMITNSIKKAKLWGYIDGSIQEPSDYDSNNIATYYDEAAAVRNAILGSLESGAQKYIEDALDPRDAWLALEKKYLTAEAEVDAELVDIEKQITNLRLEEDDDMIEHIAKFCRMRCRLNGTRFALDDQACITMLYCSLPSSYRQSVLTPEGTEMKDFGALCARLSNLSQNPEPEAPIDEPTPPPVDYTSWGVPEDIKAFGLTGDKNPLLTERAAVTCRDCLLKGHKVGTPECPQYEWRRELWGAEVDKALSNTSELAKRPVLVGTKRLSYEFSEPVKVVLGFNELGLKLMSRIEPSAIQQCAILPVINGRNVLAQAPPKNGKTTALALSILHVVDHALRHIQAIVFTSTNEKATAFQSVISRSGLSSLCYSCLSPNPLIGNTLCSPDGINQTQILVGTPDYLLGLINRNIVNMRRIRTIALDDLDKLVEAGAQEQILEVYRHVPSLAQVVASTTTLSPSIANVATKLQADPLRIVVNCDVGPSIGSHFFVKVPANQKPNVLGACFRILGASGLMVLCRDFDEIWVEYGTPFWLTLETQREAAGISERESVKSNFIDKLSAIHRRKNPGYYAYGNRIYDPVSYTTLVANSAILSTTDLSNIDTPLINYDLPKDVCDCVDQLGQWRVTDSRRSHMIINFVSANTEEINIIHELAEDYGIQIVTCTLATQVASTSNDTNPNRSTTTHPMSQFASADEYDLSPARGNNNPAPRSSQNKSQLLETMMRNVPKLKELNYAQWNNMITNSIKKAKLWGYIDGSIEEPSDHDASNLAMYYEGAAAVRNAIIGSLEPGAQRYIEDTLDAKDAWLALETKYLTAEAEIDAELIDIEKQLSGLRLEEDGDMIEHIAEFCRMRCRLNGTRFALDDQACISMLYRSLPPSYRQSVLTPERTEMQNFGILCARLSDLSQNPKQQTIVDDIPEDYTNWGVPKDVKAFELTGNKNPLLTERAMVTCRDCLLTGHKPRTLECPQYEWRRELWGTELDKSSSPEEEIEDSANNTSVESLMTFHNKRLSYEFSEPIKVVLEFDDLGLRTQLRQRLSNYYSKPSTVQQCAILPITHGRNVHIQAPQGNGKTTALAISVLQSVNPSLPHIQALILASSATGADNFKQILSNLGHGLGVNCSHPNQISFQAFAEINNQHIILGTPENLLGLICRDILDTRKLKMMVLDDVDSISDAGLEDKILEIYRHVPSLTQIIVSSTTLPTSNIKAVPKLLANPLCVIVGRDEGVCKSAPHFFVKVSMEMKRSLVRAASSAVSPAKTVVLCHSDTQISVSL